MKNRNFEKRKDVEVTSLIREAVRNKYQDPMRFALIEEVGASTGAWNDGYADAMVMHLWPSERHTIIGFEIKASRGDWLKELKDTSKSEKFSIYCDQWVILAPNGMIKPSELPPEWGLWCVNLDELSISYVKKSEKKPAANYLPRGLFASMIRRGQKAFPAPTYVGIAVKRAIEQNEALHLREVNRLGNTIDTMDAVLKRNRIVLRNRFLEHGRASMDDYVYVNEEVQSGF